MRYTEDKPIILASTSPRRKELLREAGIEFVAQDPPLPEPQDEFKALTPAQQAEALSYFKAREIADENPEELVLAADTVVAVDETILGKPADEADARRMLGLLSGTRHQVITGVTLAGRGRRLIASETTFVTMRAMSEADIDGYIASGEWQGKAGAYAIQETGDRFIEVVEGSFTNVVGLPLELVKRMLRTMKKVAPAGQIA